METMKIEIGNGGFGSSIILFLVVGFFIPAIWTVIVVIGLAVWVLSLVSQHQIASIPTSSKLQLNVPAILPSAGASLSDQDVDAIIQSAKEKAAGVARLTSSEPEARKRIFEQVFRQKCQQRGVKISKLRWKRREDCRVGFETETDRLTA
jgi:hypothetical protein